MVEREFPQNVKNILDLWMTQLPTTRASNAPSANSRTEHVTAL